MRWVYAFNTTGAFGPEPQGGDTRSHRIEAYRDVILAAIEARKDTTLVELADLLSREHGARFGPSTVWRFLDRHAITLKKTAHASEQDSPPWTFPSGFARRNLRSISPDAAAPRRAWFAGQPDLDPERLVSSTIEP